LTRTFRDLPRRKPEVLGEKSSRGDIITPCADTGLWQRNQQGLDTPEIEPRRPEVGGTRRWEPLYQARGRRSREHPAVRQAKFTEVNAEIAPGRGGPFKGPE